MLSDSTIHQMVALEYERNAAFRAHADAAIARLRQTCSGMPVDASSCLRLKTGEGAIVGKALLDDFNARASEPAWRTAQNAQPGSRRR